jgi:hypothetical protein
MRPLEVDSQDFLLDGLHVWLTLSSMCFIAVEATTAIGRSLSTFLHPVIPSSLSEEIIRSTESVDFGFLIERLPAASFDFFILFANYQVLSDCLNLVFGKYTPIADGINPISPRLII